MGHAERPQEAELAVCSSSNARRAAIPHPYENADQAQPGGLAPPPFGASLDVGLSPSLALGRSGTTRESFSQSVSVLKFGTTFKTTLPGRQPNSNRFLAGRYAGEAPVVLDIGASDGSTSLDLLGALAGQFGHYFVTDFNISVRWGVDMRGRYYFTDASGACILSASPRWLIYADVGDAPLALRLLAKRLLSGSRDVSSWEEILLVHPELVALAHADPRITIARHDVFSLGPGCDPI